MKSISILIPVYNEAATVRQAHEAVTRVMSSVADRYDYEILFTDNHSTDGTAELLAEIAAADPRVRVVRFSKNFGLQQSIFAGYALASGDAAIQLDCDLQDPPELIPQFLEAWESGYQVVYGVRRSRREGPLITLARRFFYRLLARLGQDELPLDAGEFRLVDRALIRELTKLWDYNPFLRTSIAWMGFRQHGIPYDRRERLAGESKFPLAKLVAFAVDGIVAHSVMPLRIAIFVGLFAGAAALVLAAGVLRTAVVDRQWPDPALTIVTLLALCFAATACLLGVIGEYIGRLYLQSKGRPIVVIESTINLPSAPSSIRGG